MRKTTMTDVNGGDVESNTQPGEADRYQASDNIDQSDNPVTIENLTFEPVKS